MIEGTELLAPARDLACGQAAIDAGADAVYLGAPSFGARARAGNNLDDIATLVTYAHTYWARVYVTVNTLLYDAEVDRAVSLIWQLHAIGVDAIIIQDVGLLESDLPPIPLIASTQMHNHTPARVRFLEQVGLQRAILARELTLGEIRAIRDATNTIELEAFVHGALCVSFSGQCALSYAIGGRSGNRGECAQPCRRRYDLEDSSGRILVKDRYLLSLCDMNRLGNLDSLLAAGISSFKIEGRLKDETYVINVVSAYRQALDHALASTGLRRSSSGRSRINFSPDVHKTYNRGYTPYFLHGRGASSGSRDTPKMVGEPVGTVSEVGPRSFVVQTATELHSGDGIAFFDTTATLQGTVINKTRWTSQGLLVTPNEIAGIRVGTQIHRNHDHAFLTQVRKHPPERTIDVHFTLRERVDGFELQAEDEDGNLTTVPLTIEKVLARKPQQAVETARRQIARTGNTSFHCAGITLAWEAPYFLPFSELNQLRREALEALVSLRLAQRPVARGKVFRDRTPFPESMLSYRGNVLNDRAAAFYRRHGVKEIEPAAEAGLDLRKRIVMTTRYCIQEELGGCPYVAADAAVESPLRATPGFENPLYLVDEKGHRYLLRFYCHAAPDGCEMNVIY